MAARIPTLRFKENLDEVEKLLGIHVSLTGNRPGRRHQAVDVLNKSAILFLCASFEAFIEDLAKSSYDHIVAHAPSPDHLPLALRKKISLELKESKHDLSVWSMAGEGWKNVANDYKTRMLKKHVDAFNTPKPAKIHELFKELMGYEELDQCFQWRGMKMDKGKAKLTKLVTIRGALAHGERPAPVVHKGHVKNYQWFLAPLSVRMSNDLRRFCKAITGKEPWAEAVYGTIE